MINLHNSIFSIYNLVGLEWPQKHENTKLLLCFLCFGAPYYKGPNSLLIY